MAEERRDFWDLLTLGLWTVFFALGLVPELAFFVLRELGAVPSHTALVNSSAVLTLGLTTYLALFAYRRCRESGFGSTGSQGKSLEVAMLSLVAFLEIPAKGFAFESRTLLGILLEVGELPGLYLQAVVLFVGACKILAWFYLYSLVLRYHAFGNRQVFARIPSLFPSTWHSADTKPEPPMTGEPVKPAERAAQEELERPVSGQKQG